jgi:hypothetical protein
MIAIVAVFGGLACGMLLEDHLYHNAPDALVPAFAVVSTACFSLGVAAITKYFGAW